MKSSRYTLEQVAFGLRQAEKGHPVLGGLPQYGHQRSDLLPTREEVPGDGCGQGAALQSPGGGKPQAQAAGGGPVPGQADASGRAAKKALKPAQLRPGADYLRVAYGISERWVCQVLTLPRASHRYHSVADEQATLKMRIRGVAQSRVSFGYRPLHVLLQREGWG